MEIFEALRTAPSVAEAALEKSMGTVRPDVCAMIKGVPVAIEVQMSSLSIETIMTRTIDYHQRGLYVLWLLQGLENKRVTIVGCGSLGSKIAANLAASGVNRFNLVEYDYYEPLNSVRHELGVEWFGINKAKALLSRLCSLSISWEYRRCDKTGG